MSKPPPYSTLGRGGAIGPPSYDQVSSAASISAASISAASVSAAVPSGSRAGELDIHSAFASSPDAATLGVTHATTSTDVGTTHSDVIPLAAPLRHSTSDIRYRSEVSVDSGAAGGAAPSLSLHSTSADHLIDSCRAASTDSHQSLAAASSDSCQSSARSASTSLSDVAQSGGGGGGSDGQLERAASTATDRRSSQPSDRRSSQPTDRRSSQPTDRRSSQPTDRRSSQPSDQSGGQPADGHQRRSSLVDLLVHQFSRRSSQTDREGGESAIDSDLTGGMDNEGYSPEGASGGAAAGAEATFV